MHFTCTYSNSVGHQHRTDREQVRTDYEYDKHYSRWHSIVIETMQAPL